MDCPDEPTEVLTCRLPRSKYITLGRHARDKDIPLSTMARHIFSEWLDKQLAPTARAPRGRAAPAKARTPRTNGRTTP